MRFKMIAYYAEDLEKMKNMAVFKKDEYKQYLQKIGRIII